MSRPPARRVQNRFGLSRQTCLVGGVGCVVAGSVLLHLAYEASGKSRPWGLKLLPGA